ncbi:MAG: phosphoenolpyruvate synthase [Fibrobacter sp.]|jgi:pyruvate,water dikinase|nr:phosphoenolpyruvate synthase [Fibrobacter sp.]
MLSIDSKTSENFVRRYGGGKTWHLWKMERKGLPVPAWVALEPAAFTDFLNSGNGAAQWDALITQGMNGASVEKQIEALFLATPFSPELLEWIRRLRSRLAADAISVRSSGIEEDSAQHSFAGQFNTYLNVVGESELCDAIRRCWASAYTDRSFEYRRHAGLAPQKTALCVIFQEMVPAKASGVLFTCDPVRKNAERYLLHAVPGLGEGYVSGALDPDIWELEPETGGVLHHEKAPGEENAAVLNPQQVRELWELARKIDAVYQKPMDIEWATDSQGKAWLLQARPVTTEIVSSRGRLHIWDNSNIVESYGGLTLPLTFTFARYMYHYVYVQFCEVLGVRHKDIRAMDPWLGNMLGLINGRVYYNLLNWYKLTSILPGYKHNRAFMETMMGTAHSLENEIAERIRPPAFHQSLRGKLNRMVTGFRFLGYHFRIQSVVNKFLAYFYKHYEKWNGMDFREMPAEEILQHYYELERIMLWHWKAPIINDYLCMVHFGIFRKLASAWLKELGETFPNDLMAGDGNLESAEPTRELVRMANLAHTTPGLEKLLLETEPERAMETLRQSEYGEFLERAERYIYRYGFRCMSEMKLEQKDLHQDTAPLFIFLTNLLRNGRTDLKSMDAHEHEIRSNAEKRMRQNLRGIKKRIFEFSLHHARKAVRNRENTRFCRTRVYGIVRRMFWNMGADLTNRGILKQDSDVFYLTLDDLKGALEGTNTVQDLKKLVQLRQDEYRRYQDQEPDPRFITRGPVYWNNRLQTPRETQIQDGHLRGKGCSAGIVEGIVKIVLQPGDDMRLQGEILVTQRTDPGWIPLYPSISGLLVERGGLLSHSAIVAREMGVPTIVGIAGLTKQLQNGMRIRMDGEQGTVEILENA